MTKHIVLLDDEKTCEIFDTKEEADDFFSEYWRPGLGKDTWIAMHEEMVMTYEEYKGNYSE